MSVEELLRTACEEFRIAVEPSRRGIKVHVNAIYHLLLESNAGGRRAILIIDEAQNLDPKVLEQRRLLTNLETNTRKLLQIVLIGQPELQDLLARPEMRQVAQRVVARYHLERLSLCEVNAYGTHRLRVAGASPSIFPNQLAAPLYRASQGVPRLINLICDHALLGTYVQGEEKVNASTLRQAIKEVIAVRQVPRLRKLVVAGVLALVVAAAVSVSGLSNVLRPWLEPATAKAETASAPELPVPPPSRVPELPPIVAELVPEKPEPASVVPKVRQLSSIEWPSSQSRSESDLYAFRSLLKLYGGKGSRHTAPDEDSWARSRAVRARWNWFKPSLTVDANVVAKLPDSFPPSPQVKSFTPPVVTANAGQPVLPATLPRSLEIPAVPIAVVEDNAVRAARSVSPKRRAKDVAKSSVVTAASSQKLSEPETGSQEKLLAEPAAKKKGDHDKRLVPALAAAAGGEDPLKGLPKMVISGFVNGEPGSHLAIINDRLVRKGEEVSPGLLFEKVVDGSAHFIYKGQRFRR